jgi:hypothetical protein
MGYFHRYLCNWSSLSNQLCRLSALTWKLLDEYLWSFATPGEHGATWCRETQSVPIIYNRPHGRLQNFKIPQHTYRSCSPDDKIYCRSTPELLPPGNNAYAGHSLAAFDTLCFGFGLRTPPSTLSATGKRYLLSTRKKSTNSKCSALDTKKCKSWTSAMLSLVDWIKWDVSLWTCARTLYLFEHVISNVHHGFSIAHWRFLFCVLQMLWTKCCCAALRSSSTSLLSTSMGFS